MLQNLTIPPNRTLNEIILLVFMVWLAPMPIGHRHSDRMERTPEQQWMQHLQTHHSGMEKAYDLPEEWHWHWVFPGDGYIALGGERLHAESELMLELESPLPPLGDYVCIETIPPGHEAPLSRIPEFRRHSFQSVALMHSRQSLPELLGIMRL